MIVAIDGPAGAGKSTVAKALASRLGFCYLDTGAMYRAVALAAFERWGMDVRRAELATALGDLARSVEIELRTSPAAVLLDGRDVTAEVRLSEISEAASVVAAVGAVRDALVVKQRGILADGDWVAEGRDVGTVVAADASLKIFLDADPAVRARRRAAELGANADLILVEQTIRDRRDEARTVSPLAAAKDSVLLDTTTMGVNEVVSAIAALVAERSRRSPSNR